MYYLKTGVENKETKPTEVKIPTPIQTATGLNLFQATARLGFVYIMLTGGIGEFLEVPINAATLSALSVAFFLLGVAGLIAVLGVLKRKSWALKALVAVNLLTIIFDVWGYTIQSSAFIGFIVPLLTLIMLLKAKDSWEIFK